MEDINLMLKRVLQVLRYICIIFELSRKLGSVAESPLPVEVGGGKLLCFMTGGNQEEISVDISKGISRVQSSQWSFSNRISEYIWMARTSTSRAKHTSTFKINYPSPMDGVIQAHVFFF